MDFLRLFVKSCVSVVGHSGSLVGSAGVWCCAARYHTYNWLIVLLMIMVLLIWLIMIVVADNQNSGIAYCEEMQVQGKMLKPSGLGQPRKVPRPVMVGLTDCIVSPNARKTFFFIIHNILLLVHNVQKTLVQLAWGEFEMNEFLKSSEDSPRCSSSELCIY